MSIDAPFKPNATYPRSYVLTQPFHAGATSYNPSPHYALDLSGFTGEPVYAAGSGVVFAADWNSDGWAIGGGWCAIIEHTGPGGRKSRSVYAHCQRLVVTKGQYVLRGQLVGYANTTGNASGPHCHFAFCLITGDPRVYANWQWLDPARFFHAHSYQNGSWANGDQVNSLHTRNTLLIGVSATGASRATNTRSGPYLTAPLVSTVSTRKLLVYLGTVTGTLTLGSNQWHKAYDVTARRIVYVHSALALWVL